MSNLPAIALIEFADIAVGTRATDALVKKAAVSLIRAGTLHPGKFAALFGGSVAETEEAYVEALRVGAASVLDRVLLPDVHEQVQAAILGRVGEWNADTLGIIETPTMAAVIEAADAGVKGANVTVVRIRLGDGLHGKGLAHFAGEQADVEAAVEIGAGRIAHRGQTVCTTVIPRCAADLRATLARSTYFVEEGEGKRE